MRVSAGIAPASPVPCRGVPYPTTVTAPHPTSHTRRRSRPALGRPRPSQGDSPPAVVWLLWAVAAAAAVQLAPNPLYVTLVIAISALVVEAHAREGPLADAFGVVLLVGLVFAGIRVVLTVATTHTGDDALFRLPAATLPALLGGFTVGGTVEAPVVARAAAEGLALVGVLAAFAAFNAVVSHYELAQAAPRAFYEVGLAVTVALAFVPSTIAAVGAVREADRARTGGRVVRRGRLLRQIVPILESGIERALALSESMDSRGFGRGVSQPRETAAGWLTLVGLAGLGGCFVALVARASVVAGVLGIVAALSLLGAVALVSRGNRRVRYRHRRVSRRDWALAGLVWLAPLTLAVLAAGDNPSLLWPAQHLAVPSLDLTAVLAVSFLALPVLRARR